MNYIEFAFKKQLPIQWLSFGMMWPSGWVKTSGKFSGLWRQVAGRLGINTSLRRISMAMASMRSSWARFSSVVGIYGTRCDPVHVGLQRRFSVYFWLSKDYIWARRRHFERLQIERLDSLPSPTGCPHGAWRRGGSFWSLGARRSVILGCPIKIPWWWNCLRRCQQPLKVNQLQLSAAFATPSFEAGFHVNMEGPKAAVRDGSVFWVLSLNWHGDSSLVCPPAWLFQGNFVGKEEFAGSQSCPYWLGEEISSYTDNYRPLLGSFVIWVRCRLSSERPSPSMSLKQGKQQRWIWRARNGTKST